jgi:Phage P22-like portal protein
MPATPEADRDATPAVTDEEIFFEAVERLRIAQEAEGENRQNAVIALEFEDGQQWPDDLYNMRKVQKRPTLTINHTRTMVRRVVNNMRQQRPRIKVHPVGDGADKDLASKIQGLIRHIEYRSGEGIAYDVGGESSVKIGWGYWRVLSEYIDESSFEQELKLESVRNPFTVYVDPAARAVDASDMEWCLISEKMKREEYQRKFPKEEQSEWREGAAGDRGADWETKEEIRLAEYFRITRVKDTLLKLADGRSVFKSEHDGITPVAKNLRGDDIKRPTFRRQIEWYRLNGSKIVQRVKLPGQWIPVIRCEGNTLDLNGQIRRSGMVKDMMDAARMYNYWRTKETEAIALSSLAPWIGQSDHFEGHPEWNDANQKPYSKLTYNAAYLEQPDGSKVPLPPPMRTEPVAIPAGFVNAAESAAKDLMALAGMPHEPGQDKPGEVVSGRALRERAALSDIGHFQYYDNQTRSISFTGRILMNQAGYYYTVGQVVRIVGEDGTPSTFTMTQTMLDAMKNPNMFSVVMDTGPGYETKRLEGAEAMIDLLKTPLAEPITKVGADLIVRNMDFAGSDDLADRLMPMTPQGMSKAMEGLPKEAQNIVTAMQRNMQQLQQQLQQAQLELKYKGAIEQGWMQVEREKTKAQTDVKANDAALKSHTELTDTHVKAQTSIAVAEINQAGKILDTHAQAAHDKELEKLKPKPAPKSS